MEQTLRPTSRRLSIQWTTVQRRPTTPDLRSRRYEHPLMTAGIGLVSSQPRMPALNAFASADRPAILATIVCGLSNLPDSKIVVPATHKTVGWSSVPVPDTPSAQRSPTFKVTPSSSAACPVRTHTPGRPEGDHPTTAGPHSATTTTLAYARSLTQSGPSPLKHLKNFLFGPSSTALFRPVAALSLYSNSFRTAGLSTRSSSPPLSTKSPMLCPAKAIGTTQMAILE